MKLVNSLISNQLRFLITALCCALVPLNSCDKNPKSGLKTDIQAIERRFPTLAPVIKCYWEGEITTKNSFLSVPGPSQYRMRGYIFLSDSNIERIAKKYQFIPLPVDWKPALQTPNVATLTKAPWGKSEGLKIELEAPPKIMGDFFFNPELHMIYFEITGE